MKLQFNVPDMACGACVKAITRTIKAVDQNATIEADLKTKQVEIETGSSKISIKEAIKNAGYAIA